MADIRLGPWGGVNLALHEKLLGANEAIASLNHNPSRGDLRPWKVPLNASTVSTSARKTIHMLGRDAVSDTIYWLQWSTIVHAVRSFRSEDTTKRTYYTGDGAPKVTDNLIGLASAPYPTAYRDLGIPKPLTNPTVTVDVDGTGDDETRFYAYTYVSDWDEEGPPAVSAAVTCKPGATLDITTLAMPPSGPGENRGINRMRIYRTVAGDTGAAFFFLREITVATSTEDDARAVGSDTLPSTLYAMPPTDMKYLTGLWNGMMAGISGNAVRYCEPFKPHAWPAAYETLCLDTPIALAVFKKNLLILTTGRPRLVYGSSPEAMDDTPVEFLAACIAPQSVVAFGHGACWATSDGLAYVGENGAPRLLTAGCMSKEAWQALNPATIVATQFDGLYLASYDSGGGVLKGFTFDPLAPDAGIRFLSSGFTAAHFDPLSEDTYILSGTNIQRWDAGSTNMTVTWKSKPYRMPAPVNLAVARVIADAFPVTLKLDASVRGAARPTWTKNVANGEPFTLPGGYLADYYQFEVSAATPVTGIVIAETLEELNR